MAIDLKIIEQVKQLRKKNLTQKVISEQLNISPSSVSRILKAQAEVQQKEVDVKKGVLYYAQMGHSINEISELQGLSRRRVKNLINAYNKRSKRPLKFTKLRQSRIFNR